LTAEIRDPYTAGHQQRVAKLASAIGEEIGLSQDKIEGLNIAGLGKDISIEAKILAVADVVEAMSSHRPYRPALGIDKALEEISKNRGKLYDTVVVDACTKLFNEKGFKFE
jgi:HD-GYP domain-containing protein (c-di-GMP phosphodiesterase class II)